MLVAKSTAKQRQIALRLLRESGHEGALLEPARTQTFLNGMSRVAISRLIDRLQTQAGWRDVLPPRTADRIRGRVGALHPDNGGGAEGDNPATEGGSPESRNRRMAG